MFSESATIVFDLDGTLVDAQARQVEVARHVAANLGWVDFDVTGFWAAKRRGASTARAAEILGAPPETAQRLALEWQALVEQPRWLALDRLLPGAQEALRDTAESGYTAALLTARGNPDALATQLANLGLMPLLGHVEVVQPRRATTGKEQFLRSHKPAGFIGDTESDANAARNAAIPFVAVLSGQRSGAFLRGAGARQMANSVHEALSMLIEGDASAAAADASR